MAAPEIRSFLPKKAPGVFGILGLWGGGSGFEDFWVEDEETGLEMRGWRFALRTFIRASGLEGLIFLALVA